MTVGTTLKAGERTGIATLDTDRDDTEYSDRENESSNEQPYLRTEPSGKHHPGKPMIAGSDIGR